jgi:hypothetical protein
MRRGDDSGYDVDAARVVDLGEPVERAGHPTGWCLLAHGRPEGSISAVMAPDVDVPP